MKLKITVHGVAYEVDVEILDAENELLQASPLPAVRAAAGYPPPGPATMPRPVARPASLASAPPDGGVVSPIAGTVLEIKCKPGDQVEPGRVVVVVEAMKMETAISAPAAGTVKAVPIAVGDTVRENQLLVEFE